MCCRAGIHRNFLLEQMLAGAVFLLQPYWCDADGGHFWHPVPWKHHTHCPRDPLWTHHIWPATPSRQPQGGEGQALLINSCRANCARATPAHQCTHSSHGWSLQPARLVDSPEHQQAHSNYGPPQQEGYFWSAWIWWPVGIALLGPTGCLLHKATSKARKHS